MKQDQEILQAFKNLVKTNSIILAEVVSVDTSAQTAVIKLDENGLVTDTIRLKSVIDNAETGTVIFPAVGSKVLAGKILGSDDYFLISASENSEVWLNGKANDGLVNIADLVAKLNGLVNEFNALKDAYNSHIHVTTATVGASPTPGVIAPTTSTGLPATSFNKDDFEDTTVKH